jgi:hypothetical protein
MDKKSTEEFERQFAEATRRGAERLQNEPRAVAVRYDRRKKRIVVDLSNATTFIFPPRLLQEVGAGSEDEIADVKILGQGFALEWGCLDQQFSVKGLLAGVFGTSRWMSGLKEHLSEAGKKGGASRSEAKRTASAQNGRKGGRPRKTQAA